AEAARPGGGRVAAGRSPARRRRLSRGTTTTGGSPMKTSKSKLPSGLFYRFRDRSSVIWCWYYTKGSSQPRKESTGTTDVDEAKRFRASRSAQPPHGR